MELGTKPKLELWMRIFPTDNRDFNNIRIILEKNIVLLKRPEQKRISDDNNYFFSFQTNGIFVNVSQENIFNQLIGDGFKERVKNGTNLVIFAFGSLGTGKTYSISSLVKQNECYGIIPRLLDLLFKFQKEYKELDITISISHVEIIGKNIYNLLEEENQCIFFKCPPKKVSSFEQAFNIFSKGESRRLTKNNSHIGSAVFTIDINVHTPTLNITKKSKLQMVEMSGYELMTPQTFKRPPVLGNLTKCFISTGLFWGKINSSKAQHKLRSSLLALYLGETLYSSHIKLLAHIKVTKDGINNTLSTLQFAYKLLGIPKAKETREVEITENRELYIEKLKKELESLYEKEMMNNILEGSCLPELLSKEEELDAYKQLKSYLEEKVPELPKPNEYSSQLYLIHFKNIYNRDTNELKEMISQLQKDISSFEQYKVFLKKGSNQSDKMSLKSTKSRSKATRKKKEKNDLDSFSVDSSYTEITPSEEVKPKKEALDPEITKLAQDKYKSILKEFLNRNPQSCTNIRTLNDEMNECLRVKTEAAQEQGKVREKLNTLSFGLEESSPEYNKLLAEKERIESRIKQLIVKENKAYKRYLEVKKLWSNAILELETEINEYGLSIYHKEFILPPSSNNTLDWILSSTRQ